MRRRDVKICRKCKSLYIWEHGGIIMTPLDYADRGLCENCRNRKIYKQ
jgi:hypothetical protein